MGNIGTTEIIFGLPLAQARGRKGKLSVGPFSRDEILASIDRRTRAGRILSTYEWDLANHVGGNPSATERAVIQVAALLATRIHLATAKLLEVDDKGNVDTSTDGQILAWTNSLVRTLDRLGMKAIPREIEGSINELSRHFAKAPAVKPPIDREARDAA